MGKVEAIRFKDYETLVSRFRAKFERSLKRARRLDRGENLPPKSADLLGLLTAQRIRVIHAVRLRPVPVTDLAIVFKRDRTAVKRDVKILTSFGLVSYTRKRTLPMDVAR